MNIYAGRESDIVMADPKRDRKEREDLRKELGDAIRRHLDEVKFWDADQNERDEYVATLATRRILTLYPSIHLLVRSLEEAQAGGVMWSENEQDPHGFTFWYARLGRRLGSQTCNRLGIKMCEDEGFTVAKGQEILAALEPSFLKSKEEEKSRY
jgi:hypothetical protein